MPKGRKLGVTRPVDAAPLFNSSLEKGLRVLSVFDNGHRNIGLTQIVKMTGLEKSAAQRFTSTLTELGYLKKDPLTRQYSLSPRLLHLGSSFLRGNPLVERATPYMLNCNKETSETVNLAVLDESEIIIIARIPGREVVSPNVVLGSSFPWHVTAMGQAIVASLPAECRNRIIEQTTFYPYASKTIMTRDDLARRLAEVRKSGIAVSSSETYDDDISIGAPVFDHAGNVAAAISIVGLASLWSEDEVSRLKSIARGLANSISPLQNFARPKN